MPRIVAYTYSNGSATGSTHPAFSATNTIGIIEQATSPTVTYARPTTPKPFYAPEESADQLRNWQSTLFTYTPAGVYTCTYSPTTKRVTIATSNGVPFRPVMVENLALWTGFTQELSSGWATSWTADDPPAAVAELIGVTVEPAEDGARVEVKEYRHGRGLAIPWGNHNVHRVTLYLTSENLHVFDPGFLLTGRVRIYQGSDTNDIGPDNPDGVLDGWVLASSDPTEDGDLGEVWTVSMLVAVPQ